VTPHNNVATILERLVAFESVSTASNLDIIGFCKAWLESCCFSTHLLPDVTGTKAGLVAQIGPEKPGGIILSTHKDVVPVEGQNWSSNPFKLVKQGSRFVGRGAADMKGFIASVLAATSSLSQKSLTHLLTIVLSYDEE
jgi:acetylornithine deacetylase